MGKGGKLWDIGGDYALVEDGEVEGCNVDYFNSVRGGELGFQDVVDEVRDFGSDAD